VSRRQRAQAAGPTRIPLTIWRTNWPTNWRTTRLGLLVLVGAVSVGAGCASADCKAGDDCNGNVRDTVSADDTSRTDTASTSDVANDTTEIDAAETDTSQSDAVDDTLALDQDAAPTTCSPNRNGIIERDEVPIRAGLSSKFQVATDVEGIDLAGQVIDGQLTWDFATVPLNASDALDLVELRSLEGQWFEEDFPDATYFTPLGARGDDYLGVFRASPDALELLGVVSPEGGAVATNLAYDPPVTVLRFPLEVGQSWTTESTVTGTLNGVWSVYTEDWTYSASESGELATPFATFPVIRVDAEMEQWVGTVFTSRRTTVFVTECFGTVGIVTSQDYEQDVDFTDAAEVRRLGQ